MCSVWRFVVPEHFTAAFEAAWLIDLFPWGNPNCWINTCLVCCCVAQRSPSSPRKSHFTNMNTERLLLNTSWKDSGMFVCPQVSELPPHPLSRKNSRVSKPVWWQILIPQQLRENHCGVTWQPRHVTESHTNCNLIQKIQTEVVLEIYWK